MIVEVNRILAAVTVLGFGRRAAVWVQGCRLACPGCASVDTWESGAGADWAAEDLAATLVKAIVDGGLDGLTLTGGEPLDQAAGLAEVVQLVRAGVASSLPDISPADSAKGFDVLAFTGYGLKAARKRAGRLWGLLDAVVAGPYRPDQPSSTPLIASANQELLALTPAGRGRYPLSDATARMQAVAIDGDLVMVGLPRPGDLDRLEAGLRERGVVLSDVSWRR
ncbi:MAG: radical SAM protein [Bifidobacteriaceae bacterium]|nr:radical SAM protein [Bifidobacteriaceae bacterium]